MIQTPGEPQEQRLGEVWPYPRATQNFKKDEMNGRVDILELIFEKIAKKIKNEVPGPKNVVFGSKFCAFLGPVSLILTFLQFSLNAPD